jgi:hypothetical protein
MTDLLNEEVSVFEAHRSELLGSARGKFVLIKGDEMVGVFDSEMDAIRQGYEKFGNVAFLVKLVTEFETPQDFTSNLLAI